jgi:glycerophosphoryl diester phosphodiesterase family protein
MHYKPVFCFFLSLFISTANAQEKCLKHSHSHNDYKQAQPLTDALKNKFSSVEADVFLKKGELFVSHFHPAAKSPSLETLYLKPLKELAEKQNGIIYTNASLILLIDIKSDAEKTYAALKILLSKYGGLLTRYENGKIINGAVTIILSGNKPYRTLPGEELRYAFIDQNLFTLDQPLKDVAFIMASTKYSRILKWQGKGNIPYKEKQKLTLLVKQAHSQGKIVRLWASPERSNVWKELLDCGVDLINTDELQKLNTFLSSALPF